MLETISPNVGLGSPLEGNGSCLRRELDTRELRQDGSRSREEAMGTHIEVGMPASTLQEAKLKQADRPRESGYLDQ